MRKTGKNESKKRAEPPRMNNAQRKAIVELADRRYQQLIQQAKDKNGELIEQITDQVKAELGVTVVEKQIDQLEAKIDLLKKTKTQLGFQGYNVAGKAKALIDRRVGDANKDVYVLKQKKDAMLQKLWLTQNVAETEKLLAAIPA